MGKTHRKEKTKDKTKEHAREGKNPMIKPISIIKMPSSPGPSSPKERTIPKIDITSGQTGRSTTGTRPVEEVTLSNAKTDAEVNQALNTIRKTGQKIENSMKEKKYSTWSPKDPEYTLEIDPAKQDAVIEDAPQRTSRKKRRANRREMREQAERLESTHASDWEDFPTENMPVTTADTAATAGINNMQINRKVSFDRTGKEKKGVTDYDRAKTTHPSLQKHLTTPANIKPIKRDQTGKEREKEEFHGPVKKTLAQHMGNLERTKKPQQKEGSTDKPSYSSENVLGYTRSDPKTHNRATYYSIQKNADMTEGKHSQRTAHIPAETEDRIGTANRIRMDSLAETTQIVEGQNGLWQIQKARKREVVDRIFKSKKPSTKDPFLKRVHHTVNNRAAMNERAKESKYPSTYKQPKTGEEE